MQIKGKFYHGMEIIYSLSSGEDDFFLSSERELEVGESVIVSVSRISGLFDAINERSIVRY